MIRTIENAVKTGKFGSNPATFGRALCEAYLKLRPSLMGVEIGFFTPEEIRSSTGLDCPDECGNIYVFSTAEALQEEQLEIFEDCLDLVKLQIKIWKKSFKLDEAVKVGNASELNPSDGEIYNSYKEFLEDQTVRKHNTPKKCKHCTHTHCYCDDEVKASSAGPAIDLETVELGIKSTLEANVKSARAVVDYFAEEASNYLSDTANGELRFVEDLRKALMPFYPSFDNGCEFNLKFSRTSEGGWNLSDSLNLTWKSKAEVQHNRHFWSLELPHLVEKIINNYWNVSTDVELLVPAVLSESGINPDCIYRQYRDVKTTIHGNLVNYDGMQVKTNPLHWVIMKGTVDGNGSWIEFKKWRTLVPLTSFVVCRKSEGSIVRASR